jgi:hypothetical protein
LLIFAWRWFSPQHKASIPAPVAGGQAPVMALPVKAVQVLEGIEN